MKSIGQIIDEIDRRVEAYTLNALNPDRATHIREYELHLRRLLLDMKNFILDGGTVSK